MTDNTSASEYEDTHWDALADDPAEAARKVKEARAAEAQRFREQKKAAKEAKDEARKQRRYDAAAL